MQNDANMSDSQFMRFQEKVQDKMKNYVDNFDRESRMKELKRRFEASKGQKKTFWEKLTTLFRR
jgi:hypothetical protein